MSGTLHGPALIGMGCMRLSTAATRDDERSIGVIRAALDAGVNLLDTADAYCLEQREAGHNERLIARALAGWDGDRAAIVVATKGGLVRPGGRWLADGRARHLEGAAEASREALGVERIDLYLLHAPDPRVPLGRSVRALARLQARGVVRRIGLCNVGVAQIEEAAAEAEVAAVQVRLGPWALDPVRGGVVEHCRERGILVMAHTPLGGAPGAARLERDAVVRAVAGRRGLEPAELALAWVRDLDRHVVPIPGATRPQTARSAAAGQRVDLHAEDRVALDERFGAVARLRAPIERLRPPPGAAGEVVLIMGAPAAGKSTLARSWVERGFLRLNRDESGGSLRDQLPVLESALARGERRVVLDNTYPTRAGRNQVIEVAWRHGAPVRCVWLQTTLEEASVNAVERLIERCGGLLEPADQRRLARREPAALPPGALFEYRRRLEEPVAAEGFSAIERMPFRRRPVEGRAGRAIILDCDVVSRDAGLAARERARREGRLLLGMAWRDGPAPAEIEVIRCAHRSGPPTCWCRKPLPGLAVALVRRHGLDPAGCLLLGRGPADADLAQRMGFEFAEVETGG